MEKIITTANGRPYAQAKMEPPTGQSPYFGWIDENGQPLTFRIDAVIAVFVDPRGRFAVGMSNNSQMIITTEASIG